MHAGVPDKALVNGAAASRSFHDYCGTGYFRALDGLRAISIALVILHHCPRFQSPLLQVLQENGRHGVSFFFLISGFLICTLLLREEQRTGTIALGRFYARRAARLLPLYYAVLALHAVAVFGLNLFTAEGEQLFREKLPSYVFYYSNWLPTATQGPFFYAWSLAVEEQFYLTFGLLLFLVPRPFVIGAAAAALVVKFAVYQTFGAVDVNSNVWRIVFSYQEPILLGVLLGFALNSPRVYELTARLLRPGMMVAAIWLLLGGWIGTHALTAQSAWDAQLLFLLMALVVAACVARPGPRWLERGLVAHVGKVSYGIYLFHWLVLIVIARVLPPMEWFPAACLVGTLVVVIPLASIVHRHFEAPIIAYFKQRHSRRDAARATPIAALPTAREPAGLPAIPAAGSSVAAPFVTRSLPRV